MILALSGGVGGARMLHGLEAVLGPDELTAVVNTGDDFDIHGLHVMPDVDSVLYTLAGLNDEERGWGLAAESWNFMDAVRRLGGEAWFALGDRDLATHVLRTEWLRQGASFSEATRMLCERLQVSTAVHPMSNDPVAMQLRCDGEWMSFQDYFVRHRCEPVVSELRLLGVQQASPLPDWFEPLQRSEFDAVVICPSNPFLSIDPILQLAGVRDALASFSGPVVAVSPLIGGKSVKGPAAKLMRELGHDPSCVGIANIYADLLDVFLIDVSDREQVLQLEQQGLIVGTGDILMLGDAGRKRVAQLTMDLVAKARAALA
ncbi:2-phospho-L-lactate transferase [Hydrogenophaga sp.]|uniref:2-phospho-L-lactate transferase n=1 Tax=Hydrogenophaga sp. TaxID=1904254 RepID=UPI002720BD78|nr:2-phospho-L-lactate transferase [Hydrogenophaga sp.]MDO9435904.1 2-phospho-L-lactate transferase [Hydrogenophaga sp.]